MLASYEAIFKEPSGTMNYVDVVKFIGAEPSRFMFIEKNRVIRWIAEDNSNSSINVLFSNANSEWLNSVYSKANLG